MVTEVKNKKRVEIGNNTEKEVFYIVKKRTSSVCSQKEVQPQSGLRALHEGNCRREEGRVTEDSRGWTTTTVYNHGWERWYPWE